MPENPIVDLLGMLDAARAGADGAVWSLPHGGDLDANLIHLGAGGAVGEHVNTEVDVLVVGVAGAGSIVLDGIRHDLRAGTAVLAAKGARRSLHAGGAEPLAYLTVHRARAGLGISKHPRG